MPLKNKEELKIYNKNYRLSHLEYFSEYMKDWRKNNPERMKELQKISRLKDIEKYQARDKKYSKIYREENKKIIQAKDSIRHLAKKQRVPIWADLEYIKEIYKNCPEGYHVDHIIPLQGDNVSGLHVEYNLQYLTQSDNCRKGNIYPHPEFH